MIFRFCLRFGLQAFRFLVCNGLLLCGGSSLVDCPIGGSGFGCFVSVPVLIVSMVPVSIIELIFVLIVPTAVKKYNRVVPVAIVGVVLVSIVKVIPFCCRSDSIFESINVETIYILIL